MTKIKDIINYLENIAPRGYQESYDNSGLLTGNPESEVEKVLITLDTTEDVVQEAIDKNCNLIISHHPIIFKGLKSLTGKNYVERTVIKAIQNNIAIYAIHTNLDNVIAGVNKKLAEKIGLKNLKILQPKQNMLNKLVTFIPSDETEKVMESLHKAGAGNIGNYSNCSFRIEGTGTFKPNEEANPSIGEKGILEKVTENRVEVIYPALNEQKILKALKDAHPYEEVAYYITTLENEFQEIGSGMVGYLNVPMEPKSFLNHLKDRLNLQMIRHTQLPHRKIEKVAICGGSGSFLLNAAKRVNADAFVTADFKYHEFFDAEGQIVIADIGHYESEVSTKELLVEILQEKFSNFALYLSETVTNPISYF
ncbi:MAG: Nif3-like dinuclear metal center hexameric protein [Candidatus Cyclobacteriaceae bacterium M2_1C_046]